MAMAEKHWAFMARLKKKGLWDEAKGKFDRLFASGVEKSAAWAQVRALYPCGSPVAKPAADSVPDEPDHIPKFVKLRKAQFAKKVPCTTKQALDWALEHVSFRDVRVIDAPSAKAWAFLVQMREDSSFYRDVLKRCVPNKSELSNQDGFEDDGRKEFKLINSLLAELGEGRNND
jgi:hypothetical protein